MLQKTYAFRVRWPIVRCPIDIVADFGRDIILWMKWEVLMKCYALTEGTIIQPTVVIAAVVCLCVNIATRNIYLAGVFSFFFFWRLFFSSVPQPIYCGGRYAVCVFRSEDSRNLHVSAHQYANQGHDEQWWLHGPFRRVCQVLERRRRRRNSGDDLDGTAVVVGDEERDQVRCRIVLSSSF